jgi:hypothetical protein
MLLVDEHPRGGQKPAPIIGDAEIERITQIVIGPAAPFLGVPYALPAKHLASHISIEFPILLFFLLIIASDIP